MTDERAPSGEEKTILVVEDEILVRHDISEYLRSHGFNVVEANSATEAMQVLKTQLGQHPQYVFCYKGQPIKQVGTKAWRAALERAGIEDFRWHDLRHTFASWHVQNGTPLNVLQELGGWRDSEMVQRYAHLGMEHLQSYADRYSEKAGLVELGANYTPATHINGDEEAPRVTH